MKKLILLSILLIVGCEEPAIEGCIDNRACNFNIDATKDDGSCLENDCADVCGGTAVEDDCGVCDGIDGYVAGSCYDCADVPFGTAELDNCATCDNDISNDCVKDCLGVWGGDTRMGECRVCIGGDNNLTCPEENGCQNGSWDDPCPNMGCCPDLNVKDCRCNGDCHPQWYIGDGYCDNKGTFDLMCYDEDQSDCDDMPPDTCAGQCGSWGIFCTNASENSNLGGCDADCVLYGDCCHDYLELCE